MALDSSLFTLTLQRRPADSAILDLIPFNIATSASSSNSHTSQINPLYSFSRAQSANYNVQLIDHLTSVTLSSILSPSSSDKIRKIDLYNPNESIIFERKSTLFRTDWRWTWQDQDYLIRRDGQALIVEAVRQPDPEIDIARYTSNTKTRPPFLQILDYNIQRLEVADRRGLEVIILTAICTLLDLEYDEKHKDGGFENNKGMTSSSLANSSAHSKALSSSSLSPLNAAAAANEIIIDVHSPNEVYVQHAIHLMRQDKGGQGLHMIILKANNIECTPKSVQIAAEIKLRWYRLPPIVKGRTLDPLPGSTNEIAEELYQYVRDPSLQFVSTSTTSSPSTIHKEDVPIGQRPRIKLDAPSSSPSPSPSPAAHSPAHPPSQFKKHPTYLAPPAQLDIYLSKGRIDEFELTTSSSSSLLPRQTLQSPAKSATPLIPPKNSKTDSNSVPAHKSVWSKLGIRKMNDG